MEFSENIIISSDLFYNWYIQNDLTSCAKLGVLPSGNSKGWAMASQIFGLAPVCPPGFVLNFTFNFVWLTYTADNFQTAIF